MAGNYAKSIPRDRGEAAMTNSPAPIKAQARFYREEGSTSSIQTLTDNTTQVEIGTNGGGGALLRWIPASETAVAPAGSVLANNFDHFIPANTVRTFVVPKESQGVTSIVGANVQNGLYKRMAVKSVIIGSVMTAEF